MVRGWEKMRGKQSEGRLRQREKITRVLERGIYEQGTCGTFLFLIRRRQEEWGR